MFLINEGQKTTTNKLLVKISPKDIKESTNLYFTQPFPDFFRLREGRPHPLASSMARSFFL